MSFKNMKVLFQNRLRRDVTFVKKNKKLWICFLVCVGIGFLSAINEKEKIEGAEEVFSLFSGGGEGIEYGKLVLYLLLVPVLAESILCLACGNFYILFALFCVMNYSLAKAFFVYIFKLFFGASFVYALLQAVFAFLLFCIDMFILVKLFSVLIDLIGIPCKNRRFTWTPYRCHGEKLKRCLLDAILITLACNFAITALFLALRFFCCR